MKRLFVISLLVCCPPAAYAGPAGTISSVVGEAQANQTRSPGWKAARVGAKLFVQDQLRTGAESTAELRWSSGGVVRLAEQSSMTISEVPSEGTAPEQGLKVLGGRVWANMKKISTSTQEFGIETPTAIASIRGTVFRVDMAADSATDVLVYEGKVAVGPSAGLEKNRTRPPDSSGRREVEGPSEVKGPTEVTLEEWVTIVAGQQIRVARAGTFRTWRFDRKADSLDAWVKFNLERDKAMEEK
jgi:hypothetical protein